ncbi:MAG: ergothioneine biosynthesis protein EgtB [Alphaproteobacteria bacterium]|nr:ergothioneine biosynthesis protein EgtB [Alphaproteobacteria bacterium]
MMHLDFAAARAETERLAAPLAAEDMGAQSMPDASPTKWHLAHTSWFFETFLRLAPFDPAFATLFNSYYEAVGPRPPRHRRGLMTRPTLDRVLSYRAWVTEAVLAQNDPPAAILALGVEHERQHQELMLTDILHLFSLNPLNPAYAPPPPATLGDAPPLGWVEHPGGLVEIGHDGPGFAFDNEGPRHAVWLRPFRLADRLVTNGEFRAFVARGGYLRPEWWMSDGWDAARAGDWAAPLYWRPDGRQMTLHGEVDLDDAAPVVNLSWYEADAYARWAGARLPTEEEWEAVARTVPVEGNMGALRPLPARPGQGPRQMFGDAWEWTASAYRPWPGFRPGAGALGEYNGKFMVNQMVLRGGSFASPVGHLRASYRNFFPPAARWQFAGLRLAEDR